MALMVCMRTEHGLIFLGSLGLGMAICVPRHDRKIHRGRSRTWRSGLTADDAADWVDCVGPHDIARHLDAQGGAERALGQDSSSITPLAEPAVCWSPDQRPVSRSALNPKHRQPTARVTWCAPG
jgi:hypothetical protein